MHPTITILMCVILSALVAWLAIFTADPEKLGSHAAKIVKGYHAEMQAPPPEGEG